jgi:Zn-finger nucleic acid-binding protein
VYSRGVWDDRGDVVKLVDRRGLVVRQAGYGSWRGVVRF